LVKHFDILININFLLGKCKTTVNVTKIPVRIIQALSGVHSKEVAAGTADEKIFFELYGLMTIHRTSYRT